MMVTIYEEVKASGLKCDKVFFNILISGLLFNAELDAATSILKIAMGMGIKLNMDVYTNLIRRLHSSVQRASKQIIRDRHETIMLELLQDLKANDIQVKQNLQQNIARTLYQREDYGGNQDEVPEEVRPPIRPSPKLTNPKPNTTKRTFFKAANSKSGDPNRHQPNTHSYNTHTRRKYHHQKQRNFGNRGHYKRRSSNLVETQKSNNRRQAKRTKFQKRRSEDRGRFVERLYDDYDDEWGYNRRYAKDDEGGRYFNRRQGPSTKSTRRVKNF